MDNNSIRNTKLLKKEKSALLIIDIQERILGVMQEKERLLENTKKLIKGMKILRVPIFYTEQYPKGLGKTVENIKEELDGNAIPKMSFSCSGAGDLFKSLIEKNISQVVVCGIETHVCVLQTVFDLIANGFQVNVAADAVSSRKKIDYQIALERMRANKAEISTVESIIFELLNVCGTEEFKKALEVVK